MPNEQKKKVVCPICESEHTAGEPCPNCEWDEVAETRRAKGELERERIRETLKKPAKATPKKGGFWS